ncbi:MFS general substrate transporter [Athelia psychrophila]|uniref:MFS general substrate transporter n=1 Tax=Athelia psychrophila TaxID=1759441 RepID=A0A167XIG4_9AGAM|nr:MFS general substrate transporter [Fibularhizoctonia sp. CBS 109695]
MTTQVVAAPGLLSLPRITTLVASVLVALGSGTNYVFSAYAPQLAARLHITHTRLNMIGLAGNIGVYSTGPFLGRTADTRGPRPLMVGAFILLLCGYLGIRMIFDLGSSATHPTAMFWLLVLFTFMTGAGGNGGLVSSVNATAKTFPDRARATTTGIVLSGFGLSAFFFSTISHTIYRGDTSSFLLLLAFGTSLPMILGFFFVRRIPLPAHDLVNTTEYGVIEEELPEDEPESTLASGAETPLLGGEPGVGRTSNSLELSMPRSSLADLSHRPRSSIHRPSFADSHRMHLESADISGKQLLVSLDFWIIVVIMSLLSGTGIMYINNVGSISQALFARGNPNYDEAIAAQWQATQVSLISITNFTGRVLIGMASDYAKNNLHLPRSYCITLVCALFIISQAMAFSIDDITQLWKASLALGLAYGGLFGLFPSIVIDWFGLSHFSETWGIVCLSPLIGGNLFSIAFGRNLDAHAPSSSDTPLALPLPGTVISELQCLEGRICYVASLQMTTAACCLALALGIWAAQRDRMRAALTRKPIVDWDEQS